MLDVRRLRVLREVARRGSLAGAAKALSFTPSAVSQQVAKLERETGVALLERGPRSVRLTDAGRALAEHAEAILARIAEAEASLRALADARADSLHLASFPTAAATIVPPAVAEFRRRHPDVELTLSEADPLVSLYELKEGEVDLALLFEYDFVPLPADDSVELVLLLEEPMRAVMPRGHPAARRRSVRLLDLADEAWIKTTSRSSCHLFTVRACRAAGFEPRIRSEFDSYEAMQNLVAAGVGVAMAPDLALGRIHPGVEVRPIAFKAPQRRVFAAYRADVRSPAIDAMLAVLEETVEARPPAALSAS